MLGARKAIVKKMWDRAAIAAVKERPRVKTKPWMQEKVKACDPLITIGKERPGPSSGAGKRRKSLVMQEAAQMRARRGNTRRSGVIALGRMVEVTHAVVAP